MKTNSQSIKFQSVIKSTILIFCCLIAMENTTANVKITDLRDLHKSNETPIIIKGVLVDNEGKPLNGKSMTVYIANSRTTVDLHENEPKKAGLTKIQGTGKLNMDIEGVEGGGALKMIDGSIINPQTKTDEKGWFQFNVSDKFIEGENEILITVKYDKRDSIYTVTASYPLTDKEGNTMILKIDKDTKVINLGEVRTLKE